MRSSLVSAISNEASKAGYGPDFCVLLGQGRHPERVLRGSKVPSKASLWHGCRSGNEFGNWEREFSWIVKASSESRLNNFTVAGIHLYASNRRFCSGSNCSKLISFTISGNLGTSRWEYLLSISKWFCNVALMRVASYSVNVAFICIISY